MATEDDDEFWAQVWTGNVNETDSMLESARQALDDAFVYPSDHTPPESWDECWTKFMAAWQALLEVCYALRRDERHWLAHKALTWAVAQVKDAEEGTPAGTGAPFSDGGDEDTWYQATLLDVSP